jgi:hypothetical protein
MTSQWMISATNLSGITLKSAHKRELRCGYST